MMISDYMNIFEFHFSMISIEACDFIKITVMIEATV